MTTEKKGAACASKATPATPLEIKHTSEPFIRVQGLCMRYGMSRGAIYNLIALPEFPQAIYLNAKVPLWRVAEVEAFEETRRAQGGAHGKTKRKPATAARTAALESVGVAV